MILCTSYGCRAAETNGDHKAVPASVSSMSPTIFASGRSWHADFRELQLYMSKSFAYCPFVKLPVPVMSSMAQQLPSIHMSAILSCRCFHLDGNMALMRLSNSHVHQG